MTIEELEKTNPALAKEFIQLECEMSPENLYCDGEISHSMAMAKLNHLNKRWKSLEAQVGCKVTM